MATPTPKTPLLEQDHKEARNEQRKEAQKEERKEERIIEAAIDIFLRYGYARTTMGDIAQGARISRPALYLVFPRKEDIFAAVIRRIGDTKLQELGTALPGLPTLAQRLHFCCEQWAGHGYDLTQAHPDAEDVFDLAFVPVREMYAALEAFLAAILAESLAASELQCTPQELARILIFAMRGFRTIASDGAHMRQMIALQVDVIVAALRV